MNPVVFEFPKPENESEYFLGIQNGRKGPTHMVRDVEGVIKLIKKNQWKYLGCSIQKIGGREIIVHHAADSSRLIRDIMLTCELIDIKGLLVTLV